MSLGSQHKNADLIGLRFCVIRGGVCDYLSNDNNHLSSTFTILASSVFSEPSP